MKIAVATYSTVTCGIGRLRERRGWTWSPAHWEEHRGRWHFEPGQWVRN